MYNLIPPIIIIAAVGGILVVFLKKIAKVSKEVDDGLHPREISENSAPDNAFVSEVEQAFHAYGKETTNNQITFLGRMTSKVNARARIQGIQYSLFQFLEKTLRRVKVNLMKIENAATHLTKKISEKTKTFRLPHGDTTFHNEEQNSVQTIERQVREEKEGLIITRVREREVDISETSTIVREIEEEVVQIPEQAPIEKADIEKLTPRKVIQEKAERVQKVKPEQEKEFVELEKEFIYRIAKNPNDIESYLALGNLYLSAGNYDDAEQSFRHALKINPNSRKAKRGLREIEQRGNDEDLWG